VFGLWNVANVSRQCFNVSRFQKKLERGWLTGHRPSLPRGCTVAAVHQRGTHWLGHGSLKAGTPPSSSPSPPSASSSLCRARRGGEGRHRVPPDHRLHYAHALQHPSLSNSAQISALSSSTSSTSPVSRLSLGEAAFLLLPPRDLVGVPPHERSPWSRLSKASRLPKSTKK
jgi:hypothetical protein